MTFLVSLLTASFARSSFSVLPLSTTSAGLFVKPANVNASIVASSPVATNVENVWARVEILSNVFLEISTEISITERSSLTKSTCFNIFINTANCFCFAFLNNNSLSFATISISDQPFL